jgi:hypothetical protein
MFFNVIFRRLLGRAFTGLFFLLLVYIHQRFKVNFDSKKLAEMGVNCCGPLWNLKWRFRR